MDTINDNIEKVIRFSTEQGQIKRSNAMTQIKLLMEAVFELGVDIKALEYPDVDCGCEDNLKDGIGGILHELITLSAQLDLTINECLNYACKEYKKPENENTKPCKVEKTDLIKTRGEDEPTLVGMKKAIEMIFPDPKGRPSFRAFCEWKAKKYFSSIKIGKRVWIDPARAKKELEARFTIKAD